jgi:arylsulfatase A-like enzyme
MDRTSNPGRKIGPVIVILYVMDSLRADFLSCYGYGKETSPHIDELAQEGVLFTNAFAHSTWTRASGASLLSSTYPCAHRLRTVCDALSASVPLLPEALKAAGYKTFALTTMGNISPFFGFGRGFDHFVEIYKDKDVTAKRQKIPFSKKGRRHFRRVGEEMPIVTSEDINHFLLPFLREDKGDNLFFFIWSLDTHDPYFHRDPNLARFHSCTKDIWLARDIKNMSSGKDRESLRTIYEDMIYHNDFHLGVLIRALKEMGLFDQTFFILTADHGESFGEHGSNSHGGAPYDELIRVPLIMKFPGSEFRGKRSGLVQHIDIAPTLLEVAHTSGDPMRLQGRSLLPLIREKEEINDLIFVEAQLNVNLPRYIAVRNHDYKYMEAKPGRLSTQGSVLQILSPLIRSVFRKELFFCLREDPRETAKVVRRNKNRAREFRRCAEDIVQESEKLFRGLEKEKTRRTGEDQEVAEQLKVLGYFD